MPKYSASPFNAVQMALPGRPAYVWGGFADNIAPTKMLVTNVALTTNVATLNVTVVEGNIPVVGSLITVQGTQQAAGAFNVTAVALTGVTINATTGIGTVTFALTHADVTTHADAGVAIVPQPVTFESVSTNDNSVPVSLPDCPDGKALTGFSAEVIWAPGTSGGAIAVQAADQNENGSYQTVSTITFPSTRYDPAGLSANFVRMQVSSALVGATTLAARILFR